jgi:hypothetical protein
LPFLEPARPDCFRVFRTSWRIVAVIRVCTSSFLGVLLRFHEYFPEQAHAELCDFPDAIKPNNG